MKHKWITVYESSNWTIEKDVENDRFRISEFKDCHFKDELIVSHENFYELIDMGDDRK